jgi:hypothetical protein
MVSTKGDHISAGGDSSEQSRPHSPERRTSSDLIREVAEQRRLQEAESWVRQSERARAEEDRARAKEAQREEKINNRAERYAREMRVQEIPVCYTGQERDLWKGLRSDVLSLAKAEYEIDHLNAQRAKLDWAERKSPDAKDALFALPDIKDALFVSGVMQIPDSKQIKQAREQYDKAVMAIQSKTDIVNEISIRGVKMRIRTAAIELNKARKKENKINLSFLGKMGVGISKVKNESKRAEKEHRLLGKLMNDMEKEHIQRLEFLQKKKDDPIRSEVARNLVSSQ